MKRMICDRCGLEILDKNDQYLALDGQWAWEKSVTERGGSPRGIIPCVNYARCGGEIILVNTSRRQPQPSPKTDDNIQDVGEETDD